MGKIFHTVAPLGRTGQGWIGLALLFANLICAQLSHG